MQHKILSLLRENKRQGTSFTRIMRELRLSHKEKRTVQKCLRELEKDGVVVRFKRKYFPIAKTNIIRGSFSGSDRGFGFVIPEGKQLEDIFIPPRHTKDALTGDIVEVLVKENGKKGKPEGKVIRIVKKERRKILGIYKEHLGKPFLLPFDFTSQGDVAIVQSKVLHPKQGMVVAVEREALRLTDVFGYPDDPGVDTNVIKEKYQLLSAFSKETIREAEAISGEISQELRQNRKVYREWMTVTIDGESAQDFDDAVSIKQLDGGRFLLGVHIADVSNYVRPGSFLDKEAYRRGTSVYFSDETLPMLPEKLSNYICSLRPKEEKLTFSVLIEFDKEGNMNKSNFHLSLIQTAERMTYDSVFKIFNEDIAERRKYSQLISDLLLMRTLARILRRKRVEQGSLDFDIEEPELVYKEGLLHSVALFEANEAHQVIEEFMVAANEAVASYLTQRNVPILYRIHPSPARERIEKLREILAHFGLSIPPAKKVTSKNLQRILNQVKGRPEEKFITVQVLRSLKLAVYSEENKGHYGLAKKMYTHFTSPIRRYPDLVVHRVLKSFCQRQKVNKIPLSSIARHCSEQERNASDAERDLLKWRIFRVLKRKLGEEFDGIIVDISKAGLVVELKDYFVEGLIPFMDLDGDYFYRKNKKTIIGRRSGAKYELGDWVKVTLVSVDPLLQRMHLVLTPHKEGESR